MTKRWHIESCVYIGESEKRDGEWWLCRFAVKPLKGFSPILDAQKKPKNLRWTTVPWSTRTTTSFLQMKWRDLFIQILRNFASFCLSYKVTTPWKARYILQFIDKIIGWGEGDMENVELPREGYVSGGALGELPICRFFFWRKVPSPSQTPPSKLEAGVSVWFCGHLLFDGFPGHVAKRRSCFRWDDVKKDLWLKNWVPNLWTK